MNKPNRKGLGRLLAAFRYSLRGLQGAYQTEEAFRIEVWGLVVIIPLALYLGKGNGVHLALYLGSYALILIAELLNSAIEAVVDRISLERHALSGRAKDIGSAVVFVAIVNAIIIWGALLFIA